MTEKHLFSIDSKAPDFYKWGQNCRRLGLTTAESKRVLDTFYHSPVENIDDRDDFWSGYEFEKSQES